MDGQQQASQFASSLSMVAAGFGFAIIPQSMACISHPQVTFHQMEEALKTDIALAWRKFERSPPCGALSTTFNPGALAVPGVHHLSDTLAF